MEIEKKYTVTLTEDEEATLIDMLNDAIDNAYGIIRHVYQDTFDTILDKFIAGEVKNTEGK